MKFYLKDNNIGDEGCKELAIGIELNSSIKSLNLEENYIEHIPSVFLKIPNLQTRNQDTLVEDDEDEDDEDEDDEEISDEDSEFYEENEAPTTNSPKRQKI